MTSSPRHLCRRPLTSSSNFRDVLLFQRKTIMGIPQFCFTVTVFLLSICLGVSGFTNVNDISILNALKTEWGNTVPGTWKGSDPCNSSWDGVTCTSSGQINTLQLPSKGLKGQIPVDIGHLTELQTLDLSYNPQLIGSLPQTLGNLTKLKNLVLIGCNFSGNIPVELGNLVNLEFLALNSNNLSGPIPASLGNLVKVNWLDLAENQLTGTLPVSDASQPGLDRLIAAQHFHFNQNKLTGSIPPKLFNSSMKLLHVLLHSNNFIGEIPSTLGLVQTLQALRLDRNSLNGTVPSNISDLQNLSELNLANNKLEEFPDLSGLTNLQYMDLSNNSFNSSEFPQWLKTRRGWTTILLENCGLIGQIPSEIFDLPYLQTLSVKNNHLNQTVVFNGSVSPNLQLIDLQNNSISGAPQIGSSNITILLQGNPFCQSQASGSSKFCQIYKPINYETSLAQCGGRTCSGKLKLNPGTCKCQQPYHGKLMFRAPTFSDLSNETIFQLLEQTLQSNLYVDVHLCCIYFDSKYELHSTVQLFPKDSPKDLQYSQVVNTSSQLSNHIYQAPDGFKPYIFGGETDPTGSSKLSLSRGAIAGMAVAAAVLILAIIGIGFYAFKQKKRADQAIEMHRPFVSWGVSSQNGGGAPKLKGARWFSFAEIKKLTNNFSEDNAIGIGGYGKVYKAMLDGGEMVAIKRAKQGSIQGGSEFKNEVELLSRVHHKNLVGLIGFCFEQEEQMLVYEYIPNGTLGESLSGKTGIRLDWERRLRIALGSARGLAYLHELAEPPIIHRDIKSANILLHKDLTAKVADFGISKLISDGGAQAGGKSYISAQVKGTLGYLDPEYFTTLQLSEKSDVYSFGIVLLELITARPPLQDGKFIVRLVNAALNSGGLSGLQDELMDPFLKKSAETDPLTGFKRFLNLALSCIEESGSERPAMREVVKELESIVEMGAGFSADSMPSRRDEFIEKRRPPPSYYKQDMEASNSSGSVPRKGGYSDLFEYSGDYTMSRTVQPM